MPRLSWSGFSQSDEALAQAAFDALKPEGWVISAEAEAEVLLIDLDSIYGQMSWMRGLPDGQIAVGVTAALRADTPYRLPSPFTANDLARVLDDLAGGLGHVAATAAAHGPEPPPRTTAQIAAVAAASPETTRLAARMARMSGAFAVDLDGLPRLVVDRDTKQFAPGKSLKDLSGYGFVALPAKAITALSPEDAAVALQAAGDPQPLQRLVWLLALSGGDGQLQGHGAGTRFVLSRWPQTEREFPKHFRIATVMMKGPATLAGITEASGASEADVADYINAALASGHASVVVG